VDLVPLKTVNSGQVYTIVFLELRKLGLPTWKDRGVAGCIIVFGACTDHGSENPGFLKLVIKFKHDWIVLLWIYCIHHQLNLVERRLLCCAHGKKTSKVPGTLRSMPVSFTVFRTPHITWYSTLETLAIIYGHSLLEPLALR